MTRSGLLPLRHFRRRRLAFLVIPALTVALLSCSDETDDSLTPALTVEPPTSLDGMLTVEDFEALGLEGLQAQEISAAGAFENPDPRGPCGAEIELPVLDDAKGIAFAGPQAQVVELVTPVTDEWREYIEESTADAAGPCTDWQSMTNTGSTQYVSDVEIVDLEELSSESVAFIATVGPDESGPTVQLFAVVAIAGDEVIFLQGGGGSLTSDELTGLARRAIENAEQ